MNIERIIGLWEAWDSTGSPEGPDSPITDIVVLDKILKEDPYNTCANYLVARHYIGLFDKEVREIHITRFPYNDFLYPEVLEK